MLQNYRSQLQSQLIVKLIQIISVFPGDYSWYLDLRSYIQNPFPATEFW